MKRTLIILSVLLIAALNCVSTRNDGNTSLIKSTNKNTTIINFEANIDSIGLKSLPEELLLGIKYKKEIINNLSDSCELIIGHDANYQIRVRNIKYLDNKFNLDKANVLLLHVHSPVLVFASEPEIGKRYYFKLHYNIEDNDKIQFNLLEAKALN